MDGAITHTRSLEYASYIMEAIVTNQPYKIGGNAGMVHGFLLLSFIEKSPPPAS